MDEKLKPKEAGDAPVGSFRKLNIDWLITDLLMLRTPDNFVGLLTQRICILK
jgi:hypothetical protein